MAPKGYSNHQKVADYLGTTLTAAQQTQATALVEMAEAMIDRHLGGSAWGVSAITNEEHRPDSRYLLLDKFPIATVQSITERGYLGDTFDAVLAADFEIEDAGLGVVYLPDWKGYDKVRVSYTPAAVVAMPKSIELATTILVAYWLRSNLSGFDISGLSSYRIGDEIEVKFSTGQNIGGTSRSLAFPAEALDLLEPHQRRILVA